MARSLAKSVDNGFGGFYRRLKTRRGGLVANKALARKLATMFWQIMVKGTAFVEQGLQRYKARVATTEKRLIAKLAKRHGYSRILNPCSTSTVPG
jgi:transposase